VTSATIPQIREASEPLVSSGSSVRSSEGSTPLPSKVHLPALDGVRAIAILMVIVFHSVGGLPGMNWAQNAFLGMAEQGWVGVDLFFILSGFLITGILMDARTQPHALRNFYARRVLRIVPVYVAFLLFSLSIALPMGTSSPEESALLQRTQLWYWTYSQNLLVALHSWSATAFPFAHLWSLAVEEQFYTLWPIAVLLLSRRMLAKVGILCIVAAEACRLALVHRGADGTVIYVMLPTRMDSLAAGACLACAYRSAPHWSRIKHARLFVATLAVVSLLAVYLSVRTFDKLGPLEQLVAFPALIALGSVVVVTAVDGVAWLSGRALRFLGKISYGMYMWHLVVMRLILKQVGVPNTPAPNAWWAFFVLMILGTTCGSILLALVSWHVIERPFLALKRFVPSGSASVTTAGAG
jgi:peptidoglycan/LPS O-acetylase OafA/YrhL